MGEGLPFFMPRLEMALPVELTKLERPVGSYLRENLHYTFGGFNWVKHSWTWCFRSAWNGSCSRPTTLARRWGRRAPSWINSR